MKRRAFLQALGLGAGAVAVPAIADIIPEVEPEFEHQEYSQGFGQEIRGYASEEKSNVYLGDPHDLAIRFTMVDGTEIIRHMPSTIKKTEDSYAIMGSESITIDFTGEASRVEVMIPPDVLAGLYGEGIRSLGGQWHEISVNYPHFITGSMFDICGVNMRMYST